MSNVREDEEYLNRQPAPAGRLLAYWTAAGEDQTTVYMMLATALKSEQDDLLDSANELDDYLAALKQQIENGELSDAEAVMYQRIIDQRDDTDDGDYDAADDGRPTRDLTKPFFTNYPRYDWQAQRWLAARELPDGTFVPFGELPGYPNLVATGVLPAEHVRRTTRKESK